MTRPAARGRARTWVVEGYATICGMPIRLDLKTLHGCDLCDPFCPIDGNARRYRITEIIPPARKRRGRSGK